MIVDLKLARESDSHILKNLFPLYQHEVSEFEKVSPNRHGILADDPQVSTLEQHNARLDIWWRAPDSLFPYIVYVDGLPAGFNLVAGQPHVPTGSPAEYVVHEFFMLHAFRGTKASMLGATMGFEKHRGAWEVVTYPNHHRAVAFWRKALATYCEDGYSEDVIDHSWGRKVAFRFYTTQAPSGDS